MQNVTALELATWLNESTQDAPVLLDVREPWEFETCRIEGSVAMPMNSVPDKLHELDTQQPIVCICHHGVRSRQVAMYLEQQGITNVYNLTGGVHAWALDVDSTMPTY